MEVGRPSDTLHLLKFPLPHDKVNERDEKSRRQEVLEYM
jgi:hypothetical protein